jgi:ATP-dependent Lhr-like helicase
VNRGLGLALRKRFCRRFDFELQAAASDDAVVLSLGAQQSVPLGDLPHFLSSRDVEETLTQALLASPMFQVRWRWNLGRALAVLRRRGSRRNPPPIQRMEADDLMASAFPALAACQEHVVGPIEIPDHPMVRQTIHDCLHEATDIEGLVALLGAVEAGQTRVHLRELPEPSPLSHEILNGRPYTFLDDAPLEERRTRAVALRRGLPEEVRDLGRLDPDAIARVRAEALPAPRDAEELHDTLVEMVALRPEPAWGDWFQTLVEAGRAAVVRVAGTPLWLAAENRAAVQALFPGAPIAPDVRLPDALAGRSHPDEEAAAVAAVRGHLAAAGPCTVADLAQRTALRPGLVEIALGRLEGDGFLLRGQFEAREGGDLQFCERRLLARIHRSTTERLRREIEPVTAQDLLRFLLRWQHVAPGAQVEGRRGLLAVVEQLQGFEVAAGGWERAVLPARVASYRGDWLDDLCLSGDVVWARLGIAGEGEERRGLSAPSRVTPVTFALRDNLAWLLGSARGDGAPAAPADGPTRDVWEQLRDRGALFRSELATLTGRPRGEVEDGLWDLVSRGLVTADGFGGVRALLRGRARGERGTAGSPLARGLRLTARAHIAAEGRWSLLPAGGGPGVHDGLAEAVAEQLLARWGVVFRDLLARETLALPWREVLRALRRLEARGVVRGGRFVTGFTGEQYARPEAVDGLRETRRRERTGEIVRVAAVDPLNLAGIITPGPRIPAGGRAVVTYRDGVVDREAAGATGTPLGVTR